MVKDTTGHDASTVTEGDVTRQAELMVMEYLKSMRCAKTLDAIMSHCPSSSSVGPMSSELYADDLEKKKKTGTTTVLDYVVTRLADELPALTDKTLSRGDRSNRTTTSSSSTSASRRRASTEDSGDEKGAVEWTRDEVNLLKKAIKQTSTIDDKNDRWKHIATLVGHGKTKKHCYLKYKELKEEKSSSRSSSTERPSSRRASSGGKKSATETPPTKTRSSDAPREKQTTEEEDYVTKRVPSPVTEQSTAVIATDGLQVEDCDDFDSAPAVRLSRTEQRKAKGTSSYSSSPSSVPGRPPSATEVESLRDILFPDDRKAFSAHWEEQGFFFSEVRDLRYGLIQHQGGPCGVLAVVQAYVLRFLLETVRPSDWRNPSQREQEHALVDALTHILWQAARASRHVDCLVVLNDDKVPLSSTKRKFMVGMQVSTTTSVEQTKAFVAQHVGQFTAPKGNGLVLLVLSVLLSKRVETIPPDMDFVEGAFGGGGKLIGGHDYCTQELVNLLLCGVASSNVFNGKQLLEGTSADDPNAVVLKGISSRCDVGFLSLFEAYEYIVVGSHLKRPRFNVWVVCSESHYSVFFADPTLVTNDHIHDNMPQLDIFYFDGLGNQDEEIRLTLHAAARPEKAKAKADDLVPPLNLVLQTKWPFARIDWNGVDPLL